MLKEYERFLTENLREVISAARNCSRSSRFSRSSRDCLRWRLPISVMRSSLCDSRLDRWFNSWKTTTESRNEVTINSWQFRMPLMNGALILKEFQPNKPQATGMNLGQAHRLVSRAPTLDQWLEITKYRKFVVQGFIWIYEALISKSYSTASQHGPTRQTDENWRLPTFCISFSETGFTGYRNRYQIDSNTFFKWQSPLSTNYIALFPSWPIFWHALSHSYL